MNKPKMILFDYGDTLMYEPDFEPFNGNKAIYPYIVDNPHKIELAKGDHTTGVGELCHMVLFPKET